MTTAHEAGAIFDLCVVEGITYYLRTRSSVDGIGMIRTLKTLWSRERWDAIRISAWAVWCGCEDIVDIDAESWTQLLFATGVQQSKCNYYSEICAHDKHHMRRTWKLAWQCDFCAELVCDLMLTISDRCCSSTNAVESSWQRRWQVFRQR